MNAKKYLVAAIALSAVLLAVAASYRQTKRGANELSPTALSGPGGRFGPVIETVLPDTKPGATADILDLETGRALRQPPIEYFDSRAAAIMGWIRSNGLDISCFTLSDGAACVTYDMTVVAVEGRSWDETTAEELRANPALAPGQHAPRRLLVLRQNHPDTYAFRTGEGTLGMLRIVGVSQDRRGVNIRYKLINPASGENSVATATESRAKQDL